jgi:hypothetical protein
MASQGGNIGPMGFNFSTEEPSDNKVPAFMTQMQKGDAYQFIRDQLSSGQGENGKQI